MDESQASAQANTFQIEESLKEFLEEMRVTAGKNGSFLKFAVCQSWYMCFWVGMCESVVCV